MLEETGLPYRILPVNINTGEQLRSEFLAVSPNNKIPAIVDRDNGLALFESGAVVQYLAGKTGKLLLSDVPGRYRALQWPWHVAASGPWPDRVPYAIERYRSETARLYEVPGTQLAKGEYIAGDCSIAGVAAWPWIARHECREQKLDDFPHVRRWFGVVGARPAVQRGAAVTAEGA